MPENFSFPSVGVREIWREWWLGNAEHGYPALRKLVADDVGEASQKSGKDKRRRLCDLKNIMGQMEEVRFQSVW